MKSISVIGCCVCRDLFESDTENFSFHTDIRFSSPISMISAPVDFIKADFSNFTKEVKTVNGKWYKKNLINDINKTAFKALQERHGEYLVMDFAEARISLAKISWKNRLDKLLVTNSVSFKAHYNASLKYNIFKDTKLEIINPLEYSDEFWRETIKEYSREILKIFDEEKIILVKTKQANHYIDANGYLHPYNSDAHFNSIMLSEILLDRLNEYFIEICPKCKVIEIPKYAIGLQTHKWGNHPLHFTNIFYEYLLESVKAITLENNYDKVNELYIKYERLFKKEYDEAKMKTALKSTNNGQEYSVFDILNNYEDFNSLGKKKKMQILFALDRKNFFKNVKKIIK